MHWKTDDRSIYYLGTSEPPAVYERRGLFLQALTVTLEREPLDNSTLSSPRKRGPSNHRRFHMIPDIVYWASACAEVTVGGCP
jgi:hypothetical protein